MFATVTQSSAQNKIFYGCVGKVTGILRVVSAPGQCFKFETPISWNHTGPQGPQGQPGQRGPQGPPGVGNLGVYDGSGLFLGYFVKNNFNIFTPDNDPTHIGWRLTVVIFDPKISMFISVLLMQPPRYGITTLLRNPLYLTEDCSGTPYTLCWADNGNVGQQELLTIATD
jgi:hypothetical protein